MRPLLAPLAVCAAAALPVAANAQATAAGGQASVAILGGWRQPDGSRLAAIEIRLNPGWHTYWRVPGDAGIPPSFDWGGSKNLASVTTEWPRPVLFDSDGIQTIGYSGTVVLPVRLVPRDPRAPMDLALAVFFGVCADICVPNQAEAVALIAPDAPPEGRPEIEAALAARAESAAEAGVTRVTCTLAPAADGYEIAAEISFADAPGPGQVAVLEADQPDLWVGAATSRTEGRTVSARAPVEVPGSAGPMLQRSGLRLTVIDGRRAVDIQGCAAPG
jgi:DsbC/DsbD-like thiol-disulfide interchange protein